MEDIYFLRNKENTDQFLHVNESGNYDPFYVFKEQIALACTFTHTEAVDTIKTYKHMNLQMDLATDVFMNLD